MTNRVNEEGKQSMVIIFLLGCDSEVEKLDYGNSEFVRCMEGCTRKNGILTNDTMVTSASWVRPQHTQLEAQ